MTKETLHDLVLSTKGKFFSIEFEKANGQKRIANGKNFYKSLLSGGTSTHKESKSVPFVDRNKSGFVSARGEKVVRFKCGSVVWPC